MTMRVPVRKGQKGKPTVPHRDRTKYRRNEKHKRRTNG